ncbi:hypothetical protein [Nocardia crassostreae]|uniref:hypothetical protein n=1 Tax=Nocardia crassostreae TaxID=53428 RepID=UPI000AB9DFAD|nr:hypothetical protein [Nocardia crassostreae]
MRANALVDSIAGMNTAIDPRLIARLSTEFTSLSTHMGVLGRDLEALHRQVIAEHERQTTDSGKETIAPPAATQTAGGAMPVGPGHEPGEWMRSAPTGDPETPSRPLAPPTPGRPPNPYAAPSPVPGAPVQPVPTSYTAGAMARGGQPMPGPQVGAVPGGVRGGWMGGGMYQAYPPAQPPRRLPAREPRTPWWQREGVISRVLAVAGVGVTLIGVVMLLVLAAQAGFFGPVPRVVAGAAFSAALVAVGMRVYGRAGGRWVPLRWRLRVSPGDIWMSWR